MEFEEFLHRVPKVERHRSDTAGTGRQMVEALVAHRVDALIGIGLDGEEAPDPPEELIDACTLTKRSGLHRTAHASEDAPPANMTTCLDLLDCDPTMVATDLGDEYVRLCTATGYGPDTARRRSLAGIESPWLDPVDKEGRRREPTGALERLEAELTTVA